MKSSRSTDPRQALDAIIERHVEAYGIAVTAHRLGRWGEVLQHRHTAALQHPAEVRRALDRAAALVASLDHLSRALDPPEEAPDDVGTAQVLLLLCERLSRVLAQASERARTIREEGMSS